jgi:hypothetical protein
VDNRSARPATLLVIIGTRTDAPAP